ncbi:hemagglutinin [Xylella taiwanensis]|uniref:Hemagglutinin n=1 Tax=Xylella taiwanensis TaxID=1444770 RepID=Z9JF49_9GAMM|nr:hypothetical protein [Xylella taiwanensis]AXI83687.1 hypothetical protein AB672_06950 [Xylella taiwanensis]EWS77005.1 hypothetical protein AF72_13090 [Xylella taiwanensis]MCD8456776.1 hemagglutinin [Xylella taiwanensis]MCD8459186.1 hemagglutinin [Xylella taiwanensis]MCD8461922.1 hemagglutinin [Xylella taiwanensis]
MSDTLRVFDSQVLTDDQIKNYAQQLSGNAPLKEVKHGLYTAKCDDGTILHLRALTPSPKKWNKARWAIYILNSPSLTPVANRKSVELKFR